MAGVPAFIMVFNFREGEMLVKDPFNYALGGIIYILGAAMYVIRVPERFLPGRFDIFGHSHQFLHFAVVIACMIHYNEAVELYHMRQ